MTELTIRPEEIRDAIERHVQSYTPTTSIGPPDHDNDPSG